MVNHINDTGNDNTSDDESQDKSWINQHQNTPESHDPSNRKFYENGIVVHYIVPSLK